MKRNTVIEGDVEVLGFVTEDDREVKYFTVSTRAEENASAIQKSLGDKKEVFKGLPDIRQSPDEIKQDNNLGQPTMINGFNYVEPPYDPQAMADLLESDETHFRAVTAKVLDSVGRAHMVDSFAKVVESEPTTDSTDEVITKETFLSEAKLIKDFIRQCNPIKGFEETLRCAAMDREAIGWGAIEVTRSLDKKIKHIQHVPAARLRVLRDWKGFVEVRNTPGDGPYVFYQNYGEKVGVRRSSGDVVYKDFEPYDPHLHGPLDSSNLTWNLLDRKTGKPTEDLMASANEIIWLTKSHPNTIYYGYTDLVPALSALVANTKINDYLLQFFENNTVPRYVVVIKGANVDDEFKKLINDYFTKHIRGKAHKTMVITLSNTTGKDVEVEFKRIDSENKEADFLQTRKANSQQIQTAHGTSPAILGIAESAELGSGKGLSQAELYKDRIVTPSQKYWQDQLYKVFSKGLGVIHSYLRFDPLDIRDIRMQAEVHQMYLANGALSIDEVRNEIGFETVPNGNINFIRMANGALLKIEDLSEVESTGLLEQGQSSDTPTIPADTSNVPLDEEA
jgi:capsid portal protein